MRANLDLADISAAHIYPMPAVGGKYPQSHGEEPRSLRAQELRPAGRPAPERPAPFSPRQLRLLGALGIGFADALEARLAAFRNGSDIAAELVAAGLLTERRYADCLARQLGLRFEPIGPQDRILDAADMLGRSPPRMAKVCNDRLDGRIFTCPTIESLDRFARYLAMRPEMRAMIRITRHTDVARAIDRQTMTERYLAARLSLSADTPRCSARQAIEPLQAALCLGAVLFACLALFYAPGLALTLCHGAATLFFAACLAIRVPAALMRPDAPARDLPAPGVLEIGWQGVPVYSVLVALHHETAMVPKLVAALEALDWPKTRLDVKLVCEADDEATADAVERAIAGRPHFSLVLVPPGEPRTKPKALNHALPLAHGEFLVLYDAEDEPDPGQLREAYHRFRTGPENLACLQAPLVVTNGEAHWLSALFALEYAALFRRILPWLARHGFPLSLGGTSKHFVRERLVAVGGWDSHNVTEDADLGLRLARAGYRVATITRPTFEHAPERWNVWHRQRTRWMKGWFVTYLLHMRQPLLLLDQLGARAMATFQLMFLGMIVSAFAHPIFLGVLLVQFGAVALGLADLSDLGPLVLVDMFNIVAAYGLFMALSSAGLSPDERRRLRGAYPMLPAYWGLLAFASLRALIQLLVAPHKWEKTPHGLDSRANSADPRYRIEPVFSAWPDGPSASLGGQAQRSVAVRSGPPPADGPSPA
ncbi:glycosyltransferase family 2 protein [Aurantimonas sp. 22II-16-19i]|uniref:glycosyltransferase family 2 protein n=1 Tax=Aurantimonas sp. 22II-16-19i TaxID=1317114 RepID=UPI0009F7D38E|nr:glycosyltransferase family 2 protein [Aurantimonas sp. 22II-16-19i]ORE89787.1 glycosyltransferase [Aurantimonas sp. 22II-16-19i]